MPTGAGDQRHRRHHLVDLAWCAHSATGVKRRSRLVMMPSSRLSLVDDRQAGDAVRPQMLVELLERGVGADGDRVGDHAGLGPLDEVDLVGLVLDREVAVQHAEAALAGHRDRHPRLGDGVHRRGDQRHRERDLAGQPGGGVDLAGHDVGLARQQQDVVEGEPEGGELVGARRLRVGRVGSWCCWLMRRSTSLSRCGGPRRSARLAQRAEVAHRRPDREPVRRTSGSGPRRPGRQDQRQHRLVVGAAVREHDLGGAPRRARQPGRLEQQPGRRCRAAARPGRRRSVTSRTPGSPASGASERAAPTGVPSTSAAIRLVARRRTSERRGRLACGPAIVGVARRPGPRPRTSLTRSASAAAAGVLGGGERRRSAATWTATSPDGHLHHVLHRARACRRRRVGLGVEEPWPTTSGKRRPAAARIVRAACT